MGRVYWITGLSGAGKTTIGKIFYEKLKKEYPDTVFLDGDVLRKVFGDDLGYTREDRRKCAMRYSRLCALLGGQGINVICCTISMFDSVREWNRTNIHNYTEIYVKVSMKTLRARDQKGLYSGNTNEKEKDVVGVQMDFEEPKRPDLILLNDGEMRPEELAEQIAGLEAQEKINAGYQDNSITDNKGAEIYGFAASIFHICRSITGEGVRKTLKAVSQYIGQDGGGMTIYEIPTGMKVYDWKIPKEWIIRDAYIEDEHGMRIIDMKENNLHIVSYSAPVDRWVTLEELKEYIYTQPDQPELVPYVTSYYKEIYGFCMSRQQLDSLKEGRYHMFIDSELTDGHLTYADIILPGESDQEILISSYICHPSMANNECSGPALLAELVKYVRSLRKRKYTYRFVLNPETIGSIAYISRNYTYLKEKMVAGVVLSCVGDDRDYSIIHTRSADTLADKGMTNILRFCRRFTEYSFLERGSDERQYNAPGVDLPVIGFCRTKYGMYPEYHTSADNMDLISPEGLQGSYEVMTQWIQVMEHNAKYRTTVLCEPQLGRRGLYPSVSQKSSDENEVRKMFNFIAYADGTNDLFDISEKIKVRAIELIPVVKKLYENGLIIEDV